MFKYTRESAEIQTPKHWDLICRSMTAPLCYSPFHSHEEKIGWI